MERQIWSISLKRKTLLLVTGFYTVYSNPLCSNLTKASKEMMSVKFYKLHGTFEDSSITHFKKEFT